ncbi:hypothetical protein HYV70_00515 [Candidatus Uhrbacteria bacterium]|nr:hypothetical protein [Candidatus Uhrbacteria bacterium]
MKQHHLFVLIVGIFIVGGLFLWPKFHSEQTTVNLVVKDELIGRWHAGGTNTDGFEWFMEYEFSNGSYRLNTGTDYKEEGTYRITQRYLDGSIEVEKTFDNNQKTYTMVIRTTDDPDVLFLEGVQLNRVK